MATEMTIVIASLIDREYLVAELWCVDVQWGEVSHEQGSLALEIYPNPTGKPWAFKFNDVVEILAQARHKLVKPSDSEIYPSAPDL